MHSNELLRFNWRHNEMQLLLAALHDPGPARAGHWAVRSGIELKHFAEVRKEVVRLGGLVAEDRPEGWCLWVQPSGGWRVRERHELKRWRAAWESSGQRRLGLLIEGASVAEAMAVQEIRADRSVNLIERALSPNSGQAVPKSGSPEIGDSRNPGHSDRDRELLEKKESLFSSTPIEIEGVPKSGTVMESDGFPGERRYLLEKLARMWRLEQEILKPQDERQRRMSRIFFELERDDSAWLVKTLGHLASLTQPMNKAAWLNVAMTSRMKMLKETTGPKLDA